MPSSIHTTIRYSVLLYSILLCVVLIGHTCRDYRAITDVQNSTHKEQSVSAGVSMVYTTTTTTTRRKHRKVVIVYIHTMELSLIYYCTSTDVRSRLLEFTRVFSQSKDSRNFAR